VCLLKFIRKCENVGWPVHQVSASPVAASFNDISTIG
jgi:hypothetical protein